MADYISGFMLFRLYFLFKVILQPAINDMLTFRDNKIVKEESIWLSFKINLLKKSEVTIITMFCISILCFSHLILLFDLDTFLDRADDRSNNPIFLAVYQVIITITSVGYGDFCPSSLIGRCVIMMCAIWGAAQISLIVLAVSNIFQLTEAQERHLAQVHKMKTAAVVIQRAVKYVRLKEKIIRQNNQENGLN